MPYNNLSIDEKKIIEDKGTEKPFTGEYDNFFEDGTYICRKCNSPLFPSRAKFNSGCGWPSFDEYFSFSVIKIPDPDGMRTEITCAHCGAHLGHIFTGENLTDKNTRNCVNSMSIRFIPKGKEMPKVLNE